MDWHFAIAGALVGSLVGMTGVGGGSLMAPILVIIFGFAPTAAIGTDLWFAAITKSVGAVIHRRVGTPDWAIIGRLAMGSLPAAVLTVIWLSFHEGGKLESDLLLRLLGGALLVTAALMPLKGRLTKPLLRLRDALGSSMRRHQFGVTVAAGAGVGALVTLTSVGAGAIVAVVLMFIYPLRLSARSLVGTDIIHAVPLALVAAIGHFWLGNVDWSLLGSLLLGSIPGIVVGSLLAGRIHDGWLRGALAVVLALSGGKLLMG